MKRKELAKRMKTQNCRFKERPPPKERDKPGFYLGKYLKTQQNQEQTPFSNQFSKQSVYKAQILTLLARTLGVLSTDLVLLAHRPESQSDYQILNQIRFMQKCKLFRIQNSSIGRLRDMFESLGQIINKFEKYMSQEREQVCKLSRKEDRKLEESSNCQIIFQNQESFSKFWFIILRKKLYNSLTTRKIIQALWYFLLGKNQQLFVDVVRLAAFGLHPPYTALQRFHLHQLIFNDNIQIIRKIVNCQIIFPIYAHPNEFQFSGLSPLVLALRMGKYELVALLTQLGATPILRACTFSSEGKKSRFYTKSALDFGMGNPQQLRAVLSSYYTSRDNRVSQILQGQYKNIEEMPDFVLAVDWEWISPADFLNKSCKDKLILMKQGRNVLVKMKWFPLNGVHWQLGDFTLKIDFKAGKMLIKREQNIWQVLQDWRKDLVQRQLEQLIKLRKCKIFPNLQKCQFQFNKVDQRNGLSCRKISLRIGYASQHVVEDHASTQIFKDYKAFQNYSSRNSLINLQLINKLGLLKYLKQFVPKAHSQRLLETSRVEKQSFVNIWMVKGAANSTSLIPFIKIACQYLGTPLVYEIINELLQNEKQLLSLLPIAIQVKFSNGYKLNLQLELQGLKSMQDLSEFDIQAVSKGTHKVYFTQDRQQSHSEASLKFKEMCQKDQDDLVNVLQDSLEIKQSVSPNSKYASQLDRILNFKKKKKKVDEKKAKLKKMDKHKLNVSPQAKKIQLLQEVYKESKVQRRILKSKKSDPLIRSSSLKHGLKNNPDTQQFNQLKKKKKKK